jgi:hypothetical protein
MTEFNNICRKPFWPREKKIRWLLVALDVKLPPRKQKAKAPREESSESSCQEESESEASTVHDPEVEPAENIETCYLTN